MPTTTNTLATVQRFRDEFAQAVESYNREKERDNKVMQSFRSGQACAIAGMLFDLDWIELAEYSAMMNTLK